jgi:Uma2 family endonuclease
LRLETEIIFVFGIIIFMSASFVRGISPSDDVPQRRSRLTREHVYCLLRAGLLEEGKTELLQGDLVEKVSQNKPHATCARRMTAILEDIFGRDFVAVASPVVIDEYNEPEPDIFITENSFLSYADNPTADKVRLVVEISHSTLSYDRNGKALLYAKAEIPEYWIVNVEESSVEVFRQPSETGYKQMQRFTAGQSFHALDYPNILIAVDSIF